MAALPLRDPATARDDRARPSATPPNVGTIIHQLRRAQRMSLDEVAARSGVSKSMLSKIERNQTNPTVATVWRLASAFGLPIEEIIGRGFRDGPGERDITLLKSFETPTIGSADGGCTLRLLGPMELAGSVEWYELRADPRSALESEPHEAGAIEHLTVMSGQLVVESGSRQSAVAAGETIRYAADLRHAIRNPHADPARAIIVVTHRRPRPGA